MNKMNSSSFIIPVVLAILLPALLGIGIIKFVLNQTKTNTHNFYTTEEVNYKNSIKKNFIDSKNTDINTIETNVEPKTNIKYENELNITPELTAKPESILKEVITFEGYSTKNTQTFHISKNNWIIGWATNSGKYGDMNFQIYVFDESGNFVDLAANIIGEGTDISYMRGAGNYYLSIVSGQPYAIGIAEY